MLKLNAEIKDECMYYILHAQSFEKMFWMLWMKFIISDEVWKNTVTG